MPRTIQRQQIAALHKANIPIPVIASYSECSTETVALWIKRNGHGEGINDRNRSGRPPVYSSGDQLKLIAFYCQTSPFAGKGRWTLRYAEAFLKSHPEEIFINPSHVTIGRILNKHGLKPHQVRYFLHISDPDFFAKMEILNNLYHSKPKFLYCYDECPGIQILQRLAVTILSEMTERNLKVWLEEFEYIRHGTMDILAFLHVATGRIDACCSADHTKSTFLKTFQQHAETTLEVAGEETVFYIMDNLASHYSYEFCKLIARLCKTDCPSESELKSGEARRNWLATPEHKIVVNFTPYHGSWLNMVEIWFGIMNRHCLNDSYSGPAELKEAFEGFVQFWNDELAHPFNWTYTGEGLHEKAVKRFTKILASPATSTPVKSWIKYLKLMYNLKLNYADKISNRTWDDMTSSLLKKDPELQILFNEDDGLLRKKNAKESLDKLVKILNMRTQKDIVHAA